MGFQLEVLPSGRINLSNKIPFCFNGIRTITMFKGFYTLTTEYKSTQELIDNIKEIKLLE